MMYIHRMLILRLYLRKPNLVFHCRLLPECQFLSISVLYFGHPLKSCDKYHFSERKLCHCRLVTTSPTRERFHWQALWICCKCTENFIKKNTVNLCHFVSKIISRETCSLLLVAYYVRIINSKNNTRCTKISLYEIMVWSY